MPSLCKTCGRPAPCVSVEGLHAAGWTVGGPFNSMAWQCPGCRGDELATIMEKAEMKITKRFEPAAPPRCVCGHTADQHGNIGGCGACRALPCPCIKWEDAKLPTRPGFYWALWMSCAPSTHEAHEMTLPQNWEIVEVWENFLGEPCEADRTEKFAVHVPGVREAQWLENFKWGERVPERKQS